MFDKINRIEATMTRGDFFQKMFLDTLDTPIFTTDDKGLITWANRSFLNILGRQISDVTGSGWETAIHQDDRDRVTKEWYESVEENRNFDLQYRCVRSDDEIILVRCKAFGGQKTGYFGILTKIRNFQKNKSPEVI